MDGIPDEGQRRVRSLGNAGLPRLWPVTNADETDYPPAGNASTMQSLVAPIPNIVNARNVKSPEFVWVFMWSSLSP